MPVRTVLFIGFTWPEPASTAAGHRILQLLHFFKQPAYRTVFASTAAETPLSENLEGIGVETVSIKLNDSGFDAFINALQPQIVVFDRFLTEEQFGWRVAEFAPNALRILDTEDLHSLRKTREKLLKQNPTSSLVGHLKTNAVNADSDPNDATVSGHLNQVSELADFESRTITAWLQNDLTKREIASIYRCDLSLVISSYELELLTKILKMDGSLLLHLPFMIDVLKASAIEEWPSFDARKDFVCIGNGKHAPNVDAVQWLKKEIWPLISKKLPDSHLKIYGAYLPERIQLMHCPKENFHVLGWAEDAMQVLKYSKINLALLRFGAGIKGKLVDAMRSGTPSITTSIGAEGMHSDLPWSGSIANSSEEFAQAAILLYQHPEKWRESQENGVAIINSLYDKDRLSQQLSEAIGKISKDLSRHRIQNFTGAMLMHHSAASTKYLSKWISAKNGE